jgi:hypothetical protein
MQPPPKKLLDQVRDAIRLKHYAYRTEETYVQWIRRYILFHSKRHPKEMGKAEIEAFLTHLAVEGQVSASTQNQALSALLFLYREMLGIDAVRAKRSQYVPTVLTKQKAISKPSWFGTIAPPPSSLLFSLLLPSHSPIASQNTHHFTRTRSRQQGTPHSHFSKATPMQVVNGFDYAITRADDENS